MHIFYQQQAKSLNIGNTINDMQGHGIITQTENQIIELKYNKKGATESEGGLQ